MDEITSKLKPLSIKEEDKSEVNLNEKYTWDYDDDEMNDLCTVKLFVDNLINISEDSLRIQTANRKFNQFYSDEKSKPSSPTVKFKGEKGMN